MTEQKEKGYQRIRATEAFEYENTRSDFEFCFYWEKWKPMLDSRDTGTQGSFSGKVTTGINGFTVEPVVQCDIQVVENTFMDDSK